MSIAKGKPAAAGVSHPDPKGGTGARRQGSVYGKVVYTEGTPPDRVSPSTHSPHS